MPTRLSVLGVAIPEKAIQRGRVLPLALAILAALTLLEWYFSFDYSLGIFYTIPVLLAGTVLNRGQIVAFAILCACARSQYVPAASSLEFFLKFLMATIAYCASGLLVVEMSNNRRRLVESYARLRLEQDLRRRAEEQLRILAESSPAAILTVNATSEVLAANLAAHEMLGYESGTLVGKSVESSFPVFADALKLSQKERPVRTSITGWARRRNEQLFPVQAWFSVCGRGDARFLAAIAVDISEEVRDRERENFQHLLDYNRLLAGAVSHEIRNFCSAISVVCSNLSQRAEMRANADFDALIRLVEGLTRLASFRLRHRSENQVPNADLASVLDQLRVVIEPDWDEIDGEVIWDVPDSVPAVTGDTHGLLQIFLNLCQNSLRAVDQVSDRRLTVSVSSNANDVVVTFTDTGTGVSDPAVLFHPFRPEADGTGLGLYISRELARTFGGELQHHPTDRGAEFRVILPSAHSAGAIEAEIASVSR